MNTEEILFVLKQRVRVEDCCAADLDLPNYAFCLDGTSATGKTSIIQACGLPSTKVQRYINAINCDTYFPSMLGYVSEGLSLQLSPPWRVNDRSPLNCLEWRLFWSVASYLVDKHSDGSAGFDKDTGHLMDPEDERYVHEAFDALLNSYFYRDLRARIHGLAIIDSNVRRCDERRMKRNESTNDNLRSKWVWYTPLQNMMYKRLYPTAHIDLMWFDQEDSKCVFEAIAAFVCYMVESIKSKTSATTAVPNLPVCVKLPRNNDDYFIRNMSVHVDRQYARLKCRQIVREEEEKEVAMPICVNVAENDSVFSTAMYKKLNE